MVALLVSNWRRIFFTVIAVKYFNYLLVLMLPFFIFCITYYILSEREISKNYIFCPDYRGKTIAHVAVDTTGLNISFRIIQTIFDETKPEGTVIFQHPCSQTKMNSYGVLNLKISTKSRAHEIPWVVGMMRDDAIKILEGLGILWSEIPIECEYPADFIYLQGSRNIQDVHGEMTTQAILYKAKSRLIKKYIMLNCKGLLCNDISLALSNCSIFTKCTSMDSSLNDFEHHPGIIVEGYPVFGSCVSQGATVHFWHK